MSATTQNIAGVAIFPFHHKYACQACVLCVHAQDVHHHTRDTRVKRYARVSDKRHRLILR